MLTNDERKRLADLCKLEITDEEIDGGLWIDSISKYWEPDLVISQAMMVAEAMREANTFQPSHFELVQRPIGFVANFVGDPKYNEYSDTPAQAICRAALAALEKGGA